SLMGNQTSSYLEEPTELLPNGIPSDAFIQLKTSNEPFLHVDSKDAGEMGPMGGVVGLDELALFKVFQSADKTGAMSAMFPTSAKAAIGNRTIYDFTFR